MSGIEVVGLVLAVLPLLVSATEHYREGHNFVARAIKKEFLTAKYRDELILQRILLRMYLKAVVGKTDLPHDIQIKVAEDATGEIWKDPSVVKAITEELGEAKEPFEKIIERVSSVLVKFLKSDKKFDGGSNIQLQELYQNSIMLTKKDEDQSGFLNRLKFSWKTSEWDAMIDELQDCNKKLELLSLAADRVKPFAKKQKTRNVHIAFARRANAERLYQIMHKACSCEPAGLQEIGIRLQASLSTDDQVKVQESMFGILIVDATDDAYEIMAGVETVPDYSRQQQVKFAVPPAHGISEMKLLRDICTETKAAHAARTYLRLFADHTEQIYCACIKPDEHKPLQSSQKTFTSLSELLKECQVYSSKRWMLKEKSVLAINLAYSLLQLHGSSWYNRWSANNIIFITEGRKFMTESGSIQYHMRQPYTRFPVGTGQQLTKLDSPIDAPKRRTRRNKHLHALGIVLMELHLGYSIEELAKEEETDDLRGLAQELLEDCADDFSMSREYLGAVRFCLSPHPNPHNGSFDFQDEGFREIYYAEVLAMLEENLTRNFEASESTWLFED